jgi:hypothetical protein
MFGAGFQTIRHPIEAMKISGRFIGPKVSSALKTADEYYGFTGKAKVVANSLESIGYSAVHPEETWEALKGFYGPKIIGALKTANDYYGVTDKAKFAGDVLGSIGYGAVHPDEVWLAADKFYGLKSKFGKVKTLAKDVSDVYSKVESYVTDPEKRGKFIKEQISEPAALEWERFAQFRQSLVDLWNVGYAPNKKPLAKEVRDPDKFLGKVINQLGDWTPKAVIGKAEGILGFGSAGIASVLAGWEGLKDLPYGLDEAGASITATAQKYTYQPRTEAGKKTLDTISEPFHYLGSVGISAGNRVAEVTGSPTLAALTASGMQAAPMLLPFGRGTIRSMSKAYKYGPKIAAKTGFIPSKFRKYAESRSKLLDEMIESGASPKKIKKLKDEVDFYYDTAPKKTHPPLVKLGLTSVETLRQGQKLDLKNKMRGSKFAEGGLVDEEELLPEDHTRWGISSMDYANRQLLAEARGRGEVSVDALPTDLQKYAQDEFFGLKAQYDTEQFRNSLEARKEFDDKLGEMAERRRRVTERVRTEDETEGEARTRATYERRKAEARSAGEFNIAGNVPDYNVMHFDNRRNLVGLDDDPVRFQALEDLNLLEYKALGQLRPGGRTAMMYEERTAEERAAREAAREELYSNMLGDLTSEQIDQLPGPLRNLRSEYAKTTKAISLISKAAAGVSDRDQIERNIADKKLLEERASRQRAVIEKAMAGANLMSPEFQKMVKLANSGGGIEEGTLGDIGKPIVYNEKFPFLGGIADKIIRGKRDEEYARAIASIQQDDPLLKEEGKKIDWRSAYETNPGHFLDFINKYRDKELTGADKLEYLRIFKEGLLAPPKKPSKLIEKYGEKAMEKMRENKEEMSSGLYVPTAGQEAYALAKKRYDETEGQEEDKRKFSFRDRIGGFFDSLSKFSAPVFHNGGVVSKTGKIFAQAGEVIVPKGFASGGDTDKVALQTQSIQIDVTNLVNEIKSALSEAEIKIDPNTEVKVSKPDWTVSIDPGAEVKVAQPEWRIPVDMPTDSVKVSIDLGDATTRLSESITSALSKTVQVELNNAGNAVGSDRLDEIAKTIQQVNDKIISVKNDLDGKIEMINTSNKETSSIDRIVANAVSTSILPIKQEINVLRNDIGRVDSSQRQGKTTLEAKLEQIDRRINLARNITGAGLGGYYNG